MPYITITFLCFIFHVSVADDVNSEVAHSEIAAELCPYTNLCHSNATKTLTNDELMPCCISCSCSEDCWKVGNCCPDKSLVDLQTAEFSCKATMVKQPPHFRSPFDGYSLGIQRYRIVDRCPSDELNKALLDGCQMVNKNLDEYWWVSDKTGRIFQNYYCAYCNGVYEFNRWKIRTKYPILLLSNVSTVRQTALSESCDLIVEVPASERDATDKYRCFLPTYIKCNQTGLWRTREESLERACAAYDTPYVYITSRFHLYKNVYCYMCNGFDKNNGSELCPNWFKSGKNFFNIEFSALVDLSKFEENEKIERVRNCKTDEVYDHFLDVCHKLRCPFGSMSIQGSCENIAMQTQGLTVQVDYNLKLLPNKSAISEEELGKLDKNTFSESVYKSFIKVLAPHVKKCSACRKVEIREVNSLDSVNHVEFILTIVLYTNEKCQLDTIFQVTTDVLGKDVNVAVNVKMDIKLNIDLDKRSFREVRRFPLIFRKDLKSCSVMLRLNDERICPEVVINSTDLPSETEGTVKESLAVRVAEADNYNNTLLTVCWEEYHAAMWKLLVASSVSAPTSKTLVSPVLISFAILGPRLYM